MDLPLFELCARRSAAVDESELRSRPHIYNEDGKRQTMLERLQKGPLTTKEAELVVHRGQATIGQLRGEGHVIDLEIIDGSPCYVYVGKRDVIKVDAPMQERYYRTSHWRRVAAERKHMDGYVCCQCTSTFSLNVHHWTYSLFSEDVAHDLITLCRDCHERIHEAIGGSKVHFPRSVEKHIADRINEAT